VRSLALLVALVLAVCAHDCRAAEVDVALLPLSSSVPQGAPLDIDVLAVNRSAADSGFPLGEQIRATLHAGAQSWPVTLEAQASPVAGPVPAGGFQSVRYHLLLPHEAVGSAILELDGLPQGPVRTVIDIIAADVVASAPARPAAAQARVDAFQHIRTFGDRLTTFEPLYFIAGADRPEVKFQISIKYRLVSFGSADSDRVPSTVQFGYTQRSLWDVGSQSSPFYDTSYMPELLYEWLATAKGPPTEVSGMTWLGLQTGLRHESNGREGDASRSLNYAYARALLSLGTPAGWHMVLAPEVYGYVGNLQDNPDIKQYRGYGQLRASVGQDDKTSLLATWVVAQHGSIQLDLSVPIHASVVDFSSYLLVQFFDGYGESLLAYKEHTATVRAGIQLVR
jgi:outer membrane phospholipase A